jgi:hypothetical protein
VTVSDSYPLPNMLDFSERIAGCTIFSKVDLRKGYHQILMHPGDIEKTAIATPFGLYEFLRMTFGLRNAGNTFQRQMDRLLSGLDFVFVYLDDIIIGSRSAAEHMRHLWPSSSGSRIGHQPGEVCLRSGGGGISGPPRHRRRSLPHRQQSGSHPAASGSYNGEGATGLLRGH